MSAQPQHHTVAEAIEAAATRLQSAVALLRSTLETVRRNHDTCPTCVPLIDNVLRETEETR